MSKLSAARRPQAPSWVASVTTENPSSASSSDSVRTMAPSSSTKSTRIMPLSRSGTIIAKAPRLRDAFAKNLGLLTEA